MSFVEASTYPQSAIIALQSLRDKGKIRTGQRVLINGAGGGMGIFAVQLAKYCGAEVTGVDSAMKLEMLRSIGADHVIDYAQEDYTKSERRYDLILDMVAHHSVFDYRRALNPGGIFMIVGGSLGTFLQVVLLGTLFSRMGDRKLGINAYDANNREDLAFLAKLFEDGAVVPVIDRHYALSEVPEALRYLEEEPHLGKIVITVAEQN